MGWEKREFPHMALALVIKSLISSLCGSAINPWITVFISLNGSFSTALPPQSIPTPFVFKCLQFQMC